MASGVKSCHYFVDEAGDPNLFGKRGKVIIGDAGCSKFFILGALRVDDPESLALEFNTLRAKLIADPYFASVPSFQPGNKKTAVDFHAKDDLPEVRREVFSLLMKRKDLRFFAIVRDKQKLLSYVQQRNLADAAYKYDGNELYDYLVRRLFRDMLHKDDEYRVSFARRGNSPRTQALMTALQAAQENFSRKYNHVTNHARFEVVPAYSKDVPALQAADYYLWSLQRLFERGEERYISLLRPSFRLVIDMDDNRFAAYGTYYDKKKILDAAAIKDRF